MLVIKVWCLPLMEEKRLNALHKAIVRGVCGVSELGLKDENDMTTLFPSDLMKYGLGTDIFVEITGPDDKPERTQEVRNHLARKVGGAVREFFPGAKVECCVQPFNHDQSGFWSSNM